MAAVGGEEEDVKVLVQIPYCMRFMHRVVVNDQIWFRHLPFLNISKQHTQEIFPLLRLSAGAKHELQLWQLVGHCTIDCQI